MYLWPAVLVLVASTQATEVAKCSNSDDAMWLQPNEVTISDCPGSTCTWQQNTNVSIEMQIVPSSNFKELISNTVAILFNVDGTSACPHIYNEARTEKVGCPLVAGETYVCRNTLPILELYPRVRLRVRWALSYGNEDA